MERRGEKEGRGEREGEESGEGERIAGLMKLLPTRLRATAREDLLPVRMHTYLLERSYSTRTTTKRTNFFLEVSVRQTGFKRSKSLYS